MLDKIFSSKFAILLMLTILASFPFLAKAGVYINEIAWMGTTVSTAEDEWIELRNDGGENVDLENWALVAQDGTPNINFSGVNLKNKIIPANGYFILERTNDQTLLAIPADLIYTGALSNSGENLVLKDKNGTEIDKVNASAHWPAGDNTSKQTMQKISSGWITAAGTPKAANAGQPSSSNPNGSSSSDSSQASYSSSNYSSQNSSSVSSSGVQSITSGTVTYNYKNEQISAKAGEDKTAVAGADIILEGKAFGLKKEPLDNARYLWNFGDGTYTEGQNVKHIYKYPSNYIAVLNVSSGDISASDRVNIKVVPNELQITDAKNEFIKLKNKSGIILDISGWFLRAGSSTGGTIFKFPDYSLIAANSDLIISSDVSGLKFVSNNFLAEILYPNGSVAFSYQGKATSSSSAFSALISSTPTTPVSLVASASRSSSASSIRALATLSKKSSSRKSNSNAGSSNKKIVQDAVLSAATATKPNFAQEDQLANVITIADKKDFWSGKWLWIALMTGIFGGGGLIFIRRNSGV